jgi:hypothetical protein
MYPADNRPRASGLMLWMIRWLTTFAALDAKVDQDDADHEGNDREPCRRDQSPTERDRGQERAREGPAALAVRQLSDPADREDSCYTEQPE